MEMIDKFEVKTKKVKVEFPFDHKIESPDDVGYIASRLIGRDAQESFLVFLLNTQMEVIGYSIVAVGGINYCPVDMRMVFRAAVMVGAIGTLIVHSHPSGQLNPSTEDLTLTKRIKSAADLLDISLVDHLIVSETKYNSLRQSNPELFE